MNPIPILFALFISFLTQDDPIEDKLDDSRLEYSQELERQRDGLLESLTKKEDAARSTGKVQLVEQIKKERESFELNDTLPTVVPTDIYKRGVKSAKTKLKTALDIAVREYLQAKMDTEAATLNAELEELKSETAALPSAKEKNAEKAPFVVAEWIHRPNAPGKGPNEIKLYSNGRIDNPNGRNTWSLQGRILTLRWQAPEAPGGAWVDICKLSQDRQTFTGKNQKGTDIFGRLIVRPPEAKKTNEKN